MKRCSGRARGAKSDAGTRPTKMWPRFLLSSWKRQQQEHSKCGKESLFLAASEERFRVASIQQGFKLSWLGDAQERKLASLPWDQPSEDLIFGDGRRVKFFGRLRTSPTLQCIIHAQNSHGQALWMVCHGKQTGWITKTWAANMSHYHVSCFDAAAVFELWHVTSGKGGAARDKVDATWRKLGLVTQNDDMD